MSQKNKIVLRDRQYLINHKPFFVYSGEFHYFRVPADQWEDRLKKAKQLGLNTIATYIPWIWHEPKEGQLDFTGKTKAERNLVKFIELIDKHGLKCLARIGPIIHGEVKNGGLPQWLVDQPGGISIKNFDGSPCVVDWLPSFYKANYRNKVSAWYDAVLPIMKKYQINNGGPIFQIQLDNEIHMMNWLGKAADYNDESNARYRAFLANKYQSIDELNQAYQSSYPSFDEVDQPEGRTDKENWTRLWDWSSYYRDHYAGYFEYLAKLVKEHGIDTVLSANVAQYVDFNMYGRGWESIANTDIFKDFDKKVPGTIFGGAFQMRHLDFENYHDIIYTVETLKTITSKDSPVNCAELQVGVLNDRPRIYSSDVELNLKTSIAHGLNGVNGYMMFGGQSPDEIQMRGNYHEWQAPIDSNGLIKEHAEPLKRFGKFLKFFGEDFAQTQSCYDLAIGYDPKYYATEFIKDGFYDYVQHERNLHFFDGSARVLEMLGYKAELLDLERVSLEDLLARKVLWVFSLEFMSNSVMEKISQFVEQGGKLILNHKFPVKDEQMNASSYLADQFGIEVESVSPMAAGNYYRLNKMNYMVESDMTTFKTDHVKVLLNNHNGQACCIQKQVGKGSIMVIGVGLYHQYNYIIELTEHLLAKFKIEPLIKKSRWDVHAALRMNGQSGWLYVANFHDANSDISLEYRLPGSSKTKTFPSKGKLVLPNRSSFYFPVNLKINDHITIIEASCEIIGVRFLFKGKQLELTINGINDQKTQIILSTEKRIKSAKIEEEKVNLVHNTRHSSLSFDANGGVQKLMINL